MLIVLGMTYPRMISEAVTIEDFDHIAFLLRDVGRDHVATAVEAWSAAFTKMHDLFRHLPPWGNEEDPFFARSDHRGPLARSLDGHHVEVPGIGRVNKSASVNAAFTLDPVAFIVSSFHRTRLLHLQAFSESVALAESHHEAFNIKHVRLKLLSEGNEGFVAVTVSAWSSRLHLGRISSDLMTLRGKF